MKLKPFENTSPVFLGEDARGAIVLQNGIAVTPLNGYSPVLHATIENNTVVNCCQSLVIGYQDKDAQDATVAPADCILSGNMFVADAEQTVVHRRDEPTRFRWAANMAFGQELGMNPIDGFRLTSALPPPFPAPSHLEAVSNTTGARH